MLGSARNSPSCKPNSLTANCRWPICARTRRIRGALPAGSRRSLCRTRRLERKDRRIRGGSHRYRTRKVGGIGGESTGGGILRRRPWRGRKSDGLFAIAGIKKLFRDVVRQVHPDNATDEADRAVRNRLMAEANLAYRRGDADALRKILEEYKSSPESVKGDGAAADLQRVLRQIERIVKRLAQIESEVAELTSSEIAKLMAKAETAKTKGETCLRK